MPTAKMIIYPVSDLTKAKEVFTPFIGVEPYVDEVYYVGYRTGDQEIGLNPRGHRQGMAGPVCYWKVENIQQTLRRLLATGAVLRQDVTDVGDGRLVATVADADGNDLGLLQDQ
ncbi:VOC family protein [Nonomuraea aurantiaca]|uniref:VOC family protein n=1 Tax=Nonomuraea aurantiaca TaxID=2878562 RepID=UPI001CDA115B|nr:glyoxalase [Nonomuraea aurantiaca]MCA2221135.1 glyoxalase [Nonomuraea aurantiaca]